MTPGNVATIVEKITGKCTSWEPLGSRGAGTILEIQHLLQQYKYSMISSRSLNTKSTILNYIVAYINLLVSYINSETIVLYIDIIIDDIIIYVCILYL